MLSYHIVSKTETQPNNKKRIVSTPISEYRNDPFLLISMCFDEFGTKLFRVLDGFFL